jgi:excisionase family DNA binding protein
MDVEEQSWMTVKETAAMLRIPPTRCYELIHAGELPGAVRIGERSIRVNRRELEQVLLEYHRADYSFTTSLAAKSRTTGPVEKATAAKEVHGG